MWELKESRGLNLPLRDKTPGGLMWELKGSHDRCDVGPTYAEEMIPSDLTRNKSCEMPGALLRQRVALVGKLRSRERHGQPGELRDFETRIACCVVRHATFGGAPEYQAAHVIGLVESFHPLNRGA